MLMVANNHAPNYKMQPQTYTTSEAHGQLFNLFASLLSILIFMFLFILFLHVVVGETLFYNIIANRELLSVLNKALEQLPFCPQRLKCCSP